MIKVIRTFHSAIRTKLGYYGNTEPTLKVVEGRIYLCTKCDNYFYNQGHQCHLEPSKQVK